MVKFSPTVTLMGFSHGALSQMLAEAAIIDKNAAARIRYRTLLIGHSSKTHFKNTNI
jgi:hypothetical protein